MARIAKQMVYTPTTIMQLLDAWKNATIRGSNIPHGETLLYFALPDKAESFTPNAPAAYGLVDCMRGSMRQHFAGTRANYNSFMSMFSRWKKDFADKEAWDKEIAANPKANVHTKMSTEYADMVMMLQRPVTGWVSYEAWLLILGKAGVLDPAVITAVPRHLQSIRENMQRMYREWMELEDKLEAERLERLKLARRVRESALPRPGGSLADAAELLAQLEAARDESRRQAALIEELYREIRALRIYEGATDVQKIVIAREALKSYSS